MVDVYRICGAPGMDLELVTHAGINRGLIFRHKSEVSKSICRSGLDRKNMPRSVVGHFDSPEESCLNAEFFHFIPQTLHR